MDETTRKYLKRKLDKFHSRHLYLKLGIGLVSFGISIFAFILLIHNHFENLLASSAETATHLPFSSDANQVSESIYRSLCSSTNATFCRIEIRSNGRLLATSPLGTKLDGLWVTEHNYKVSTYSPPLFIRTQVIPSINLISRYGVVSLLIFLILNLTAGVIWYFLQIQRRENEIARLRLESEMNEIIARAAHDIRAPLMALQSFTNLVTDENNRSLMTKISNRIQNIADEMLATRKTLSKQTLVLRSRSIGEQAAPERIAKMPVSVKELECSIQDIVTEFRNRIEPNRISIEWISSVNERDQSKKLISDIPMLKRMIANLITNSIEAIQSHGKIWIEVASEVDLIEISVRDTGRGAPPEILQKIFDKDYSYQKPDGSGLGLFWAKQVIESWGGSITANSLAGRGFTVRIRLSIDSLTDTPKFLARVGEHGLDMRQTFVAPL